MAKLNGILKIEGSIEDLTFYKKDGKNYVRKKGGVSKERIQNDPNFIRTRENGSEFSHCARAGKILREAIGSMVFRAKDNKLSSRMLKEMSKLKNLDGTSTRGNRNVGEGIATPEGKQVFKGFDFNINAPLRSVLFAPFELNVINGDINFKDFIPAEQIQFPTGATHFSLQGAFVKLDFKTGISDITYTSTENFPINHKPIAPLLVQSGIPQGKETSFYLLLISFFQEINGQQYSLRNETYNVLNIIEVL